MIKNSARRVRKAAVSFLWQLIWAIRFIDFRNDFGSHPLNKRVGCYSHVVSFGNQKPKLIVEILDMKTYEIIKSYEINPNEDIKKLYEYLEELAEIYETQWVNI